MDPWSIKKQGKYNLAYIHSYEISFQIIVGALKPIEWPGRSTVLSPFYFYCRSAKIIKK